jgi:hypothetical protein
MFKLETKNPPRTKLVKEQAYIPGAVRVYKNSPSDMILQMWMPNGRYMLVALYPAEARAIADALYATADEFMTPLEPEELNAAIAKAEGTS